MPCVGAGKGTHGFSGSGTPGGFEPFPPSAGTSLSVPESHPWEDLHQMSLGVLWGGLANKHAKPGGHKVTEQILQMTDAWDNQNT